MALDRHTQSTEGQLTPRRGDLIGAIVGAVIGVALITLMVAEGRRDAAPVNQWCEAHYRAARSAVESLAVDQMLNDPNPGKRGLANQRFCGDFRVALERYQQRHRGETPAPPSP